MVTGHILWICCLASLLLGYTQPVAATRTRSITRTPSPSLSSSPSASGATRTRLHSKTLTQSFSMSQTSTPSTTRHRSSSLDHTGSTTLPHTYSATSTITAGTVSRSISSTDTGTIVSQTGEVSQTITKPTATRTYGTVSSGGTSSATSSLSKTQSRLTKSSEPSTSETRTISTTNIFSTSNSFTDSNELTGSRTVAASATFVVVPTDTKSFSKSPTPSFDGTVSDTTARTSTATFSASEERRSASATTDATQSKTGSHSSDRSASSSPTRSPSSEPTSSRTNSLSPTNTYSASSAATSSATETSTKTATFSSERTASPSSELTSSDTLVSTPSQTFDGWSGSWTSSPTNLASSTRTASTTVDMSRSNSQTQSASTDPSSSSSASHSTSRTESLTLDRTETMTYSETVTLLPPFPVVPLTFSRFSVTWLGAMWFDALAENATLVAETVIVDVARLLDLPTHRIMVTSMRAGSLIAEVTIVRNNSQVIPDFMIQRYLAEGNYSSLFSRYINMTSDPSIGPAQFVGAVVFPVQLVRQQNSPVTCDTFCVIVVTSTICGVAVLIVLVYVYWRCVLKKPMLQKWFQRRQMHIEVNSPAGLMPSAILHRKTMALQVKAELEHIRAATFREPFDPDDDGEEEQKKIQLKVLKPSSAVSRTKSQIPVLLPSGFASLRKVKTGVMWPHRGYQPSHEGKGELCEDSGECGVDDDESPQPYRSRFRLSNTMEVESASDKDEGADDDDESFPASANDVRRPRAPNRHHTVTILPPAPSLCEEEAHSQPNIEGSAIGFTAARIGSDSDVTADSSDAVLVSSRSIVLPRASRSFVPARVILPETFSYYVAANSEHEQHERNPLNSDQVVLEEAFVAAGAQAEGSH